MGRETPFVNNLASMLCSHIRLLMIKLLLKELF